MNITHISVSRKQVWDLCKQSYKYKYHLKIPSKEPEPIYFRYGKIVHKIGEIYVLNKGEVPLGECVDRIMKKKEPVDTDAKGNPVFAKKLPAEYAKKLDRHCRVIHGLHEKIGFEGEVEWDFEFDLDPPNGKTVKGFIDRLVLKDGYWYIIDYKTSRKGSQYLKDHKTILDDLQCRVYARVVQKTFNVEADKIKAALYYLDVPKMVGATFSQKSLDKAESDLIEAYDEITNMPPEHAWGNVGNHCKRCDWRKLCPFWSTTGVGR